MQVLQKLCPHVARMHLCMTWPDTFFPLSRFREVTHLSIYRSAGLILWMFFHTLDRHGSLCLYHCLISGEL